jgi:branched-chain amino acid transport system permease protein
VGFAGRLSLCQLTFAGIGAAVVSQFGLTGDPFALLFAAAVVGAIGALIAIPMLRLSGIYLALGTAAFAVAMDRWLFTLPPFTWFGQELALFPDQSITAERFDIAGLSLDGSQEYLIFGSVVFVALCFVVVWIRRSVLGRRLLAMKDAPAACATLGMDVRALTLSVFAISAALAGIGGALYASALQSASSAQFDFLTGLPILLLMAVAGVNSIGAALIVGIVLGTPIVTNVFPQFAQLTATLIGFAAIAVGRNPNGFIASELKPRWAAVGRAPRVLTVFMIILVTVWILRLQEVMDNWTWAITSLAVLLLLPVAASITTRQDRTDRAAHDLPTCERTQVMKRQRA